jgi:tetratricopeptide (TPR) repeat protein
MMVAGFGAVALAGAVALVAQRSGAPKAPEIVEGRVALGSISAIGDDAEAKEFASRLERAFRDALAGYHIETVAAGGDPSTAELVISTEVAREGEVIVVTSSVDDRKSGATIWSLQRAAEGTVGVEAHAVARALQCALGHRTRGAPKDMFAVFLRYCGKMVFADYAGEAAERSKICNAGRPERFVKSWCVASAGGDLLNLPVGPARAKAIAETRDRVQAALKDDPGNANLFGAMALTYAAEGGRSLERAEWLERAMAANPDLPGMRAGYSMMLSEVGRFAEATEQSLQQYAQAPLWQSGLRAARMAAGQGDWARAREIFSSVRKIEPRDADRHELTTLVLYGEPEEAKAALDARAEVLGLDREDIECNRAIVDVRLGKSVDRKILGEVCKRGGAMFLSRALSIAGDVDGALAVIERYLENPKFGPPQIFYPEMRPLWGDDRFWRIAAKMGLTDYWTKSGHWPDFCAEPDLPFDCKAKADAARAALAPAQQPATGD